MSRLQELIREHCPDGVEYKALGELGAFYGGLTGKSKKDFGDGAKFVTYNNVYGNPAVDLEEYGLVSVGPDERQNSVELGDVLFTISSENREEAGLTSVMTVDPVEPWYLNSFCTGWRLHDKSILLPDFLKHVLRGPEVREAISRTANGVTRFNISKPRLAKVRIPVPPIEVQREVVRILDEYTAAHDELVRQLEEEMALLSKQREIALMNLNNDLVSSGYPLEPLGDHADVLSGFPFKSSGYVDEGIPVCGGVSIMPGYIDWTTCRYWPTDEGLEQFVLESGNIVMALDRPWVSGGFKLAQISEDVGNPLLVQRTARVRGKDMIQPFIRALMEMDAFRDHCAATGNTVPHVSHKKIESYMVPVPPIDEQEDYVRQAGGISSTTREIADNLNNERAYLDQQLALVRNQLLSFPEKVA
ncbi:MAG: restriction endonuclease subunit S [Atopobiaceae bacterium]|nr:restriction endonuclease subunit S [Atopobiaceae bacterium]